MSSAPDFDRLARIYRWMEVATFGNALWRCRCTFLDELRTCRRALVLGDGDGRFTARLLEVNPVIEIDALDASAEMLRTLAGRAGAHRGRVRTSCVDIREWQPTEMHYDLVVSHFFLDCLTTEEVAMLAGKVRRCLLPGARWLISEFAVPEGWIGRTIAMPLVSTLYVAFGALTGLRVRQLPRYTEALLGEGFSQEAERVFLGGILVTELWSPPR